MNGPAPQSFSNLPSPQPEVKVRTMRSDLESLMKSGGVAPQAVSVKAPGLENLVDDARAESAAPKTEAPKGSTGRAATTNTLATTATVVVALALLAAIIYFGYQLFFLTPSG